MATQWRGLQQIILLSPPPRPMRSGLPEFVRQCLYPNMDVQVISVTESWAQYAVAGPQAKITAENHRPNIPSIMRLFPLWPVVTLPLWWAKRPPVPVLFRANWPMIAVPTRYGDALMRKIMTAGQSFNVTPYGLALSVMRIEKGILLVMNLMVQHQPITLD